MTKQVPDMRVFGLGTIGEKGQIVIPAAARRELSLHSGDEVIVVGSLSKKFLGIVREQDFRELLSSMQQRLEQGLAMGDHFANVAKQLDDLKK